MRFLAHLHAEAVDVVKVRDALETVRWDESGDPACNCSVLRVCVVVAAAARLHVLGARRP